MDLDTAVQRLFVPAARPGRIGAEVELIPVTDTIRPCPVDPEDLAAGFDDAFVRAAVPSFEPGGQLELSPPPRATATALARDLGAMLRHATAIAAKRGIRLEALGVNPHHSCDEVPLRLRNARYLAMQEMFDQIGPAGRQMMRLTASLQVTIDLLPGRDGQDQWLVANLAGPSLAAAFANSGSPAGGRTRIWQQVDLRRTGYDGRHFDLLDPVGSYAAFARAAPRLPIAEARCPFFHLSTLFPPVRPRGGYLEVRYLDAQPFWRIGEAIATVAALLYDTRARHEALDLLLPQAGDFERAWTESAAGARADADALLAIAGAALGREAPGLLRGGVS